MNQRAAVHFQAPEQRLRELAELTALGGMLRGQSALVAWLEDRSRMLPRKKAGSHFGSHSKGRPEPISGPSNRASSIARSNLLQAPRLSMSGPAGERSSTSAAGGG